MSQEFTFLTHPLGDSLGGGRQTLGESIYSLRVEKHLLGVQARTVSWKKLGVQCVPRECKMMMK